MDKKTQLERPEALKAKDSKTCRQQ